MLYDKMSRRFTKPTESATTQSSVLAFTKAIQNVSKSQQSFNKSIEGLESLISDTFTEIELKLCAKQKELVELDEKFEYDERKRKLDKQYFLLNLNRVLNIKYPTQYTTTINC